METFRDLNGSSQKFSDAGRRAAARPDRALSRARWRWLAVALARKTAPTIPVPRSASAPSPSTAAATTRGACSSSVRRRAGGTVEQITDPGYATTAFPKGLKAVDGCRDLPLIEAAQA